MRRLLRAGWALLVVVPVCVLLAVPVKAGFGTADVLVSDGSSGQVLEFSQSGSAVRQLPSGQSDVSGSAFDGSGNFYATNFSANMVTKFDVNGVKVGAFGAGYDAHPESVVFNSAGDAFVGEADGTHKVLEFDPTGKMIASFTPEVDSRGTDWIELAADQCTMLYTSEGTKVKSFNVCTNHQNSDLATGLPGAAAYELRIRPNGEILVADSDAVIRLSSTGSMLQKYTVPGTPASLFALNLDPDGTSVWTADLTLGGTVAKIDLASGKVVHQWSAGSSVMPAGLAVQGEIVVGGGGCAAVVSCVGGSGAAALAAAGAALVVVAGGAGFTAMKGSHGPAGVLEPAHAVAHHAAVVAGSTGSGPADAAARANMAATGPAHPPPVHAAAPTTGGETVHSSVTPSGGDAGSTTTSGAEGGAGRIQEEAGAKLLEVGETGLEVGSEEAAVVSPALAPLPPPVPEPPVTGPPAVPSPPGAEPGLPGGSRVARDEDEKEGEQGEHKPNGA
jgi:hypothetical protein